jgi:hypothetical protein
MLARVLTPAGLKGSPKANPRPRLSQVLSGEREGGPFSCRHPASGKSPPGGGVGAEAAHSIERGGAIAAACRLYDPCCPLPQTSECGARCASSSDNCIQLRPCFNIFVRALLRPY